MTKLWAFYLPQFHPIPENDAWWGKGFTEWSNVQSAKPQFSGHQQPKIPLAGGYYDLRDSEVMLQQAELAQGYGINGFVFYHYWFKGKRLLETPVQSVLENRRFTLPFCLCWANESWTRRWDGKESDVLLEQTYSAEDDLVHIRELLPIFTDERYLKHRGRPVLLVYRSEALPDAVATAALWRAEVKKAGFPDLYLLRVEGITADINPASHGFDAAVEFGPDWRCLRQRVYLDKHECWSREENGAVSGTVKNRVFFYDDVVAAMLAKKKPEYKRYYGVFPAWDNTARRQHNATIIHKATPDAYQRFLREVVVRTCREFDEDDRFIFINAWNEWGEGCYLEADDKYGIGFLEATRLVSKLYEVKSEKSTAQSLPCNQITIPAKANTGNISMLNQCCHDVETVFKEKLDAEEVKNEREKQEIWEARLWFEQQYETLRNSKSYLLGYYLIRIFSMDKPFYNLYRLALLPIPAGLQKRFKKPSCYAGIIGRCWSRLLLSGNALLTQYCKRSIKPIEITQQPWSGPLVSVIVTCYNYGSFLKPVLSCLEAQSWADFEIILIDDGSTEPETVARINELREVQSSRFTVMQQPNQGVIAARNNAIAKARGKYIFPLDADDTIDKTFLEKCLLFLENSPEHFFAYTWTNSTGADEFIWQTRDSSPKSSLEENRMGYAMFRKTAFDQVGGYNPVMAGGYEDWELCVNLVAHGYVGRVIREPLYNYYVKPGARNYHAIKKHDELKNRIGSLHWAAIKTKEKMLLKLACQPYTVNSSLVNLGVGVGDEGKFILLDFYRECNVSQLQLQTVVRKVEKFSAKVLITADLCWRDFFISHKFDNLFVYFPEEYHPDHLVEPFYKYIELRYQPQRVAPFEF